jgi:hypothetical protein
MAQQCQQDGASNSQWEIRNQIITSWVMFSGKNERITKHVVQLSNSLKREYYTNQLIGFYA